MNKVKHLELGQTVMTASVSNLIEAGKLSLAHYGEILHKQKNLDWGESRDKAANDAAAQSGEDRCMGVHRYNGITLWVITEWDRSVTTVLLPSDY